MRFLVNWLVYALGLMIVAHVVPGFHVQSFGTALLAAVVIGLINATIGVVLFILTLPLNLLTFGLFQFVLNAIMIMLASGLVRGFTVDGFGTALLGALVLAVVNAILRAVVSE